MATLKQLHEKREALLVEIASVTYDLKEYTKFPCESVDIESIKYQYGFILRQIKEIDNGIKIILLSQVENLDVSFKNLETLLQIEESKRRFTVADLPKKHYSMFDEPFL